MDNVLNTVCTLYILDLFLFFISLQKTFLSLLLLFIQNPFFLFFFFRGHLLQEVHVLLRVELRHFFPRRPVLPVNVHLFIQAVGKQQVVRHLQTVRFHRVPRAVVVVPNVMVVKVRNTFLRHRRRKEREREKRFETTSYMCTMNWTFGKESINKPNDR